MEVYVELFAAVLYVDRHDPPRNKEGIDREPRLLRHGEIEQGYGELVPFAPHEDVAGEGGPLVGEVLVADGETEPVEEDVVEYLHLLHGGALRGALLLILHQASEELLREEIARDIHIEQ